MSDLCQPQYRILWARYINDDEGDGQSLRTDGACCWYCFRVWNVAFSASTTLIEFKAGLRKSGEEADTLNEQLTKYTAWLIAKVVEYTEACGGSREGMRLASWLASLRPLEHQ